MVVVYHFHPILHAVLVVSHINILTLGDQFIVEPFRCSLHVQFDANDGVKEDADAVRSDTTEEEREEVDDAEAGEEGGAPAEADEGGDAPAEAVETPEVLTEVEETGTLKETESQIRLKKKVCIEKCVAKRLQEDKGAMGQPVINGVSYDGSTDKCWCVRNMASMRAAVSDLTQTCFLEG